MKAKPMRIVQIVSGLEESDGGPSYSVPRLNAALRQAGIDAQVFCDGVDNLPHTFDETVHLFPRQFDGAPILSKLHVSSGLLRALLDPVERFDIVHSHGMWRMANVYAMRTARRRKIPMVVSPRGMLSTVALKLSRHSKNLFWFLGQGAALRAAECFHASSTAEYHDIRCAGIKAPIAIVPNGVDPPAFVEEIAKIVRSESDRLKNLLYLGRIHPIKGVDVLVKAWGRVAHEFPDWRLRIVGPGEPAHIGTIKEIIKGQYIPRVTIQGALYGDSKFRAFAEADLFVQPSFSESFGLTVAEFPRLPSARDCDKGSALAGRGNTRLRMVD